MVVVMAKDAKVHTLDNQHVANIFLTRTNRFPNGLKAIPIELKNSEIRANFYEEISGKNPTQLMAYWTTLIFSGKGKPPKGYNNVGALISRLENNLGCISYMSLAQVTDDLKIVYRFP
jgi:hypothetical protein